MPTRVHIHISVKPGTGEEFVDAYRVVRPRVATVDGYHEEELLLDEADPDKFLLATLWDSKEAFLTWQQAPVHMEMTAEMHPYFAQRSEIRYYDVKEGPVRT
jgi:heme-degrading monooxygenase HmoA